MFKNHNNVGLEYRHATKMIIFQFIFSFFFTPTSASETISTVCGGLLHTLKHLSVLKTFNYCPHCKIVVEIALNGVLGFRKQGIYCPKVPVVLYHTPPGRLKMYIRRIRKLDSTIH